MRVFVAVADAQGFAAAARRLAMSPPAVTRSIAALEEHLGTRLLRRTTRVVRLTDAGARYLADCKRILGEVEEAEAGATSDGAELQGTLHVTASVNFGRIFVAPIVYEFLALHPRVAVRTLIVDRVVNLVEEGVDVGVRIAHMPDSSLRAVRVGSIRRVLVASPEYLKRRGRPAKPADLEGHDTIAFTTSGQNPHWTLTLDGRPLTVAQNARLMVNTADVAIGAARAGHGLVRVLSYMVQAELRAHELEIVLADFEPQPVPVQLVHAGGDRASAKVRAFVDFATARLRQLAAQGAFGSREGRTAKDAKGRAAGGS
jgi:DNA-binding transcriptional LysR family regulator